MDNIQMKVVFDETKPYDLTNSVNWRAPDVVSGYTTRMAIFSTDTPFNLPDDNKYKYSAEGSASTGSFIGRDKTINNILIQNDMPEFSFGLWFKINSNYTPYGYIFINAESGSHGHFIQVHPDFIRFVYSDQTYHGYVSLYSNIDNSTRKYYDIEEWHWLLFSKNTDNIYQTFIDGILVDSRTNTTDFQFFTTKSTYNGTMLNCYHYRDNNINIFNGRLFDITLTNVGVPNIKSPQRILIPINMWDGNIEIITQRDKLNIY